MAKMQSLLLKKNTALFQHYFIFSTVIYLDKLVLGEGSIIVDVDFLKNLSSFHLPADKQTKCFALFREDVQKISTAHVLNESTTIGYNTMAA